MNIPPYENMKKDELLTAAIKKEDTTKIGNRKWRRKMNAIYKYKKY